MNLKNLEQNYPQLISHMQETNYSSSYINWFQHEVSHIFRLSESIALSSYNDALLDYVVSGRSQSYIATARTVLRAIERFDKNGEYPDGTQKQTLKCKHSYDKLCPEFRSIIDCFVEIEAERGIKQSSIKVESQNTAAFFLEIQQSGIEHLHEITEENVINTFLDEKNALKKGYAAKKNIAAVLYACSDRYPECANIKALLPALKRRRKNIPYLTGDEVLKIKQALFSTENGLSLRDKAIGIIAISTGLRRCDIAGMTMASVDFDNDMLRIRQQKTDIPLCIPMTATVGNAIYDYINIERAAGNRNYVFLAGKRPYNGLSTSSVNDVIRRIMHIAGVRTNHGDHCGVHLFRHYVASTLLSNGVQRPVISSLVGHSSPESLNDYLNTDFAHLKDCALSVEQFPIRDEVFEIE